MAHIRLTNMRTYVTMTETPPTPRFKNFDNIELRDIYVYARWSICVRVEVKFRSNRYGDNIYFILIDKNVSTKNF